MTTPIHHITPIDNLPGIVAAGGLYCDSDRPTQCPLSVSIAHEHIKERRRKKAVPVAMQGSLADYVPFYFATFYFANRSPMLYAIHTGHVSGYAGGQGAVIYLVSSVERVVTGDQAWCFTDGHAVELVTRFFNDATKLQHPLI